MRPEHPEPMMMTLRTLSVIEIGIDSLTAKKDATAFGGRLARYFLRVRAGANQRAAQRILTSKGGLANGNATQTITGGTGR